MFTQTAYKRYRQCLSVLGLNEEAMFDDVRTAYRHLAKQWHPDRFTQRPSDQVIAEQRMKEINQAYTWLVTNQWVFGIDWDQKNEQASANEPYPEPASSIIVETKPVKKEGIGCVWGIVFWITLKAMETMIINGNYDYLIALIVVIAVVVLVVRRKPSYKN